MNFFFCKLEPDIWSFISLFFWSILDLFKSLVWPENLFTGLLHIKIIKYSILFTSKYVRKVELKSRKTYTYIEEKKKVTCNFFFIKTSPENPKRCEKMLWYIFSSLPSSHINKHHNFNFSFIMITIYIFKIKLHKSLSFNYPQSTWKDMIVLWVQGCIPWLSLHSPFSLKHGILEWMFSCRV